MWSLGDITINCYLAKYSFKIVNIPKCTKQKVGQVTKLVFNPIMMKKHEREHIVLHNSPKQLKYASCNGPHCLHNNVGSCHNLLHYVYSLHHLMDIHSRKCTFQACQSMTIFPRGLFLHVGYSGGWVAKTHKHTVTIPLSLFMALCQSLLTI